VDEGRERAEGVGSAKKKRELNDRYRNGTGLLWSEAKEVQEDKARPESTAIGQPIVLRFMGLYRCMPLFSFLVAFRSADAR